VFAGAKSMLKRSLRPLYFRTVSAVRSARIRYGSPPGPRELLIDPTYHCNLDCVSCKCTQIAHEFPRERELSLEEYKGIFSQFKALGGKTVSIYGGEPLLARDLPETIRAAKALGLRTMMATNGLLLNDERIVSLSGAGLDLLSISVDGVGKTYEQIAGRDRFEQLTRSLRTLSRLQTDKRVSLKTCVHSTVLRQNAESLVDILDFAHDMGIGTISFQYVSRVPAENDTKTEKMLGVQFLQAWNHWDISDTVLVTREQLPALMAQVSELKRRAKKLNMALSIDPALDSRFDERALVEGSFKCSLPCILPWHSVFVGPLGDLAPCVMLTHYPTANVRDVTLADYWRDNAGLLGLRRILLTDRRLPVCANCCGHTAMMA
jgi:PqqA peptide cyclase